MITDWHVVLIFCGPEQVWTVIYYTVSWKLLCDVAKQAPSWAGGATVKLVCGVMWLLFEWFCI